MKRLLAAALLVCGCAREPVRAGAVPVVIKGAVAFSEDDLARVVENDLKRYAERPGDAPLDDAVFRIGQYYRLRGYADVRVTFKASPERILFRVAEGPLVRLGRVHFVGNRAVSEKELETLEPHGFLGRMPPYSDQLVAALVTDILALYHSKGYVDATVTPEERRNNVTLTISEGIAHRVARLEGLPGPPELDARLEALIGRSFTPRTVEEVEAAVVDHYRENGHPFVEARTESRSQEGSVTLALDVRPGAAAKVGGAHFSGNERTREGFLRHRVDMDPGAPVRTSDLRRAERRLLETGLFRSARVEAGAYDEKTGEAALDVTVEERKPGEASVRVGYGALERLRLGGDLSYYNLLGGAEFVRVGGTASHIGFRTEADLALPYFLGSEFRPGFGGYYEERDFPSFEAISYGTAASVRYPVLENLRLTGGLRYAIIETVDVEPNVPPGDLLDFDYTAPFVSVEWDARDDALVPTRGVLLGTDVQWSDASFNSDVQFLDLEGRMNYYLPLPWGLVFASSLKGGRIVPVDDTEQIPISLRKFAGGTDTVRGFEFGSLGPKAGDDPLGGEAYVALQAEVRFPIWQRLYGAAFSDRGEVWFETDDVTMRDLRYSVGAGVRYYTPAGAIVLDAGWNPDRDEGERAVELHLSVGFPF